MIRLNNVFLKIKGIIIRSIGIPLSYVLKVEPNKIVFDNFIGKGYGGNPKYIAEQLLNDKDNTWELIWLVDNVLYDIPNEIKKIKYGSFLSIYHLATAKVWIDNVRNAHLIPKKKEQIYIQTWHGAFGPKMCEKDAIDDLSSKYIKKAKYDGSITDAILSENKVKTKLYRRAFWLNKETQILEIGSPCNDILFDHKTMKQKRYDFRKKMLINDKDILILYAPTFRDDYNLSVYNLDFEQIINCMEKVTDKNVKVIIRLHPNIRDKGLDIKYNDKILNGSYYSDEMDVLCSSDILITDFSSILYSFMIWEKPIFLCALDYDEYLNERNLYDYFFSTPLSFSKSNEQLINAIISFDYNKYKLELSDFLKKIDIYDDGHASENLVKWIKKKI